MLRFLKGLFTCISKVEKFLREKQIGKLRGSALIFLGIIIIGLFGMLLLDNFNNDFVMRLCAFFFGSFFYSVIPLAVIREGTIRKYIIFGRKSTFAEVIKRFNVRSYIVFLLVFSFVIFFPIVGIPILLSLFNIRFLADFLLTNFNKLIYINIIVSSFFWFVYHIVYETVKLQEVKIKVALFTAIATTITVILSSKIYEDFLFVISCLLLSYLWVQYIIEVKLAE
ncbi:MAG TPA: hypothetical protein PLG67_06175 [Bacillota bacterium]|nr:MAG: hypothetical protein BWY74_02488 [Firmicutes bacterium ADurb.Bin419]HQL36168.1 hypothetical protein [Bacillota bacterium]